ncbi:MAG: phosphomannomutase/phosphoglucomutase [Parvibaculaceae bacterium]
MLRKVPVQSRPPLIKANGFREYDARWLYGPEIDRAGMESLGLALGTLIRARGVKPHVVTGHDFRSYSEEVKTALISGLVASGCTVHDIGLALSPMAYFAQFALDVPAVAMVTASHNENGWTGVKMGIEPPFTFGPEDMAALKQLVLGGGGAQAGGGKRVEASGLAERYREDLCNGGKLGRRLKVVVACGNGTAGAFAPQILANLGCEVVPLHCELDYTFPHYNPNPEDMRMLRDISVAVKAAGADIGFGFDGDGDRCGIVDNEGRPIFADKIGVLLARDLSSRHANARFVADVKSTVLFQTDPVLKANGARTEYWKTGHSYMKRRVSETSALAGFEKSGHFFFAPPLGRGYDDAILSAITILRMLDRAKGKSLADLYDGLPQTWETPTMSPSCADDRKYAVVDQVMRHFQDLAAKGQGLAGRTIRSISTVNGMRITLDDGTWGLVRASSNKPELVIVCESPTSEEMTRAMFQHIETCLQAIPDVGPFNQRI